MKYSPYAHSQGAKRTAWLFIISFIHLYPLITHYTLEIITFGIADRLWFTVSIWLSGGKTLTSPRLAAILLKSFERTSGTSQRRITQKQVESSTQVKRVINEMQQGHCLENLKVKEIRHLLVDNPATVYPTASLLEVLAEMEHDLRTRHVYVVDDDNRLLGTVRMGSVVEYLFPFDAVVEKSATLYNPFIPNINAKTAADLMRSPVASVSEETTLGEMARLLMREAINELPVVDESGHLFGQVNMYETIKAYLGTERRTSE